MSSFWVKRENKRDIFDALFAAFVGLVNKANQSADIQAVRQMNTALSIEVEKPTDIIQVVAILKDNGFNTEKGLLPLYQGYAFYWYKTTNRIVCVDIADGKFDLVFPENINGFPETQTVVCSGDKTPPLRYYPPPQA